MSILIKDTTKEERERIVAESLGNINSSCDGCMSGLADMYQDYIDGKKEIKYINMEFRAHAPFDELLKDADVIFHTLNDPTKAIRDKEKARYDSLCEEFGMYVPT